MDFIMNEYLTKIYEKLLFIYKYFSNNFLNNFIKNKIFVKYKFISIVHISFSYCSSLKYFKHILYTLLTIF